MNITKTLTESQFKQINKLWNDEYPLKLKDRFKILLDDCENYTHYLIEDEAKNILAWAVAFEKENETRFSIIVQSSQKGKGLGGMLLKYLKEEEREIYGWVIDHNNDKKANGENYQSPLSFYVKQGFDILHDIRIDNDLLNAVKIKFRR
ncbi:MAG: N-acetyltransferase [Pedobacter sp.]|nr:MAG: N-acetyltransferase [Pedobacter sp.]